MIRTPPPAIPYPKPLIACLLLIYLCFAFSPRGTAQCRMNGGGSALSTPQLKIMPLGDSNTYGYTPDGYRVHLAKLLQARNVNFTFVGCESDTRLSEFPNNAHEGHIGWGLDDLLNGREGVFPMKSVAALQPDLILLMAGTNDLGWKAYSVEKAQANMVLLLDQLRLQAPKAKIFVATLLPFVNMSITPHVAQPENQSILAFNRWLKSEVARRNQLATAPTLTLVDLYASFDFKDSIDGIHATDNGYQGIASSWNAALQFWPPFAH
jgi:hypothetical protein